MSGQKRGRNDSTPVWAYITESATGKVTRRSFLFDGAHAAQPPIRFGDEYCGAGLHICDREGRRVYGAQAARDSSFLIARYCIARQYGASIDLRAASRSDRRPPG